jgi:hypothetical protein
LGVTLAQATHPNTTASTRGTAQRDTRHTLQNFTEVGIPLPFNFLTTNHDFAGGGFTALLGVVVSTAGNFDAAHV